MRAQQRLFLTSDRQRLVDEGDRRAAFLYAAEGDHIPESAALRFGLVDGALPQRAKAGGAKSRPPRQDKSGRPEGDKASAPAADKAGDESPPKDAS